jgi:hypothetical protein
MFSLKEVNYGTEKKDIKKWVEEHKTELIIAGVSIASIVAAFFAIKKHEELEELLATLTMNVKKSPVSLNVSESEMITLSNVVNPSEEVLENAVECIASITRAPHEVSEHIRNLHEGYNASAKKIAQALEEGIVLEAGQTIVDSYRTGVKVA